MIRTSLEDVKTVLKNNLRLEGMDIASLDENAPFFEGLGLDSLDAIQLVIILRKNYDIIIENMEQASAIFQSMGTLRRYIEENRKK
ncbi:MAG: phosphopantetheine-binding protein [Spirochaetota bacterium]|jgi:acyl carrier protein|nr:phosphopantetheine-binding protein [Spirochaetota bacterium]